MTAEENVRAGGFGEAVIALLHDHDLGDALLLNLTMPDEIVDHGPQKVYREVYDLDGEGIARRTAEAIEGRAASAAKAGEATERAASLAG